MMTIIRKLIGFAILISGFCVSGYGIFILGGSIYYSIYSQSHPEKFGFGDAAGMGFMYGLVLITAGMLPIAISSLIVSGKKSIIYKVFNNENK